MKDHLNLCFELQISSLPYHFETIKSNHGFGEAIKMSGIVY